jgi:hypothetical protein
MIQDDMGIGRRSTPSTPIAKLVEPPYNSDTYRQGVEASGQINYNFQRNAALPEN